jgi:hypothetical protein
VRYSLATVGGRILVTDLTELRVLETAAYFVRIGTPVIVSQYDYGTFVKSMTFGYADSVKEDLP